MCERTEQWEQTESKERTEVTEMPRPLRQFALVFENTRLRRCQRTVHVATYTEKEAKEAWRLYALPGERLVRVVPEMVVPEPEIVH